MNNHTTPTAHKYAQHCNEQTPINLNTDIFYIPGPAPTGKIAIVTCMDARLDIFKMFNLKIGEAHVIRVGGGRTPDALRSLVASQHVLGTEEIMVVHHTDCGFMQASTDDEAHTHIEQSLETANGKHISTRHLPIQVIPQGDLTRSVREDIQFLRSSPYIRKDTTITGWTYDTLTGKIQEVSEYGTVVKKVEVVKKVDTYPVTGSTTNGTSVN